MKLLNGDDKICVGIILRNNLVSQLITGGCEMLYKSVLSQIFNGMTFVELISRNT
jgi:hypothetical protein